MTARPTYQFTDSMVTLVFEDGAFHQIQKANPRFNRLMEALLSEASVEDLLAIINESTDEALTAVIAQAGGTTAPAEKIQASVDEKTGAMSLTINDISFDGKIADHLRKAMIDNNDLVIKGVSAMITRASKSMSAAAIHQMLDYISRNNLIITDTGSFIGFKAVTNNYESKTSGTHGRLKFPIGASVTNPQTRPTFQTGGSCNTGIHFGPVNYVGGFFNPGDRVLLVEILPEDMIWFSSYERKARTHRIERVLCEVVSSDKSQTEQNVARAFITRLEEMCTAKVVITVDEVLAVFGTDSSSTSTTTPKKATTPKKSPAKKALAKTKAAAKKITAAKASAKRPAVKKAPAKKAPAKKTPVKAPAKKAAAKKTATVTQLETKAFGTLTKAKLTKLIKDHGSASGVAKHYGVSAGTIAWYKKQLGM